MLQILQFVIKNIRRRRLRNWLTIAGIIVGVLAIVSLMSLSKGLEESIDKTYNTMGSKKITISSKYQGFGGSFSSSLNTDDIRTLENISELELVAPAINGSIDTKYGSRNTLVTIVGYRKEDMEKLFEQDGSELESGKIISDNKAKMVVIGHSYTDPKKTDLLFGKTLDIGKRITIGGEVYTVVGILKDTGGRDNQMYMSLDNIRKLTNANEKDIDIIYGILKSDKADIKDIRKKIETKLERSRGTDDFKVMTPDQASEERKKNLGMVSIVVVGIACISLLVGGIGILNSMYTSVVERTREIGIMKALGAKRKDILTIFILEAGIIGFIGGVMGLILGLGLSFAVKAVTAQLGINLTVSTNITIFIFGFGFSFILGIVSGLLPAIRAANQEPVEALREE
ncbi:MAG: ABC transporter permease [archaeon]